MGNWRWISLQFLANIGNAQRYLSCFVWFVAHIHQTPSQNINRNSQFSLKLNKTKKSSALERVAHELLKWYSPFYYFISFSILFCFKLHKKNVKKIQFFLQLEKQTKVNDINKKKYFLIFPECIHYVNFIGNQKKMYLYGLLNFCFVPENYHQFCKEV